MKKMAFISRHQPTLSQILTAQAAGYSLQHVGDRDAFTVDLWEFAQFDCVAVVNPAAALRLLSLGNAVGVFENCGRAPSGARPQFALKALHVFKANGNVVDHQVTNEPVCFVETYPAIDVVPVETACNCGSGSTWSTCCAGKGGH